MKITKIKLENYKSIKDLTMDFKKSSTKIKDLIAIYGENGAGKTNVFDALKNLCVSLQTMSSAAQLTVMIAKKSQEDDTGDLYDPESLQDIYFLSKSKNINNVFQNSHMIDEKENTKIIYYFSIDGKEGKYSIELSSKDELIHEKLEYIIKKRIGVLFDIKRDASTNKVIEKYNKNLVADRKIKKDLHEEVRRFWGKHSFLSIVNFIIQNGTYDESYLIKNISKNLIRVIFEFQRIMFYKNNADVSQQRIFKYEKILEDFSEGSLKKTDENSQKIKNTEKLLNEILPQLNPRISYVEYKLKSLDDSTWRYELYLCKLIGGRNREVKFSYESDGTKNIIRLLPFLLGAMTGQIVIIDEIDNGIHDLLMEGIIEEFKNSIDGQLIFTTHDTLLMKRLKKESVYLINIDSDGNKEAYSLDEFPIKDSSRRNKTKEYLEGKFEAIPYVDNINFSYIKSILEEEF